MNRSTLEGFNVIGLSARVRNDEPLGIAALWERFFQSNLSEKVPDTIGGNVHCVYHNYEGDYSAPFDMTIGYRVPDDALCPEGLSRVSIPSQTVIAFDAVGAQPEAVVSQWKAIWQSDLDRSYIADFDIYDAENQERVHVTVGVNPRRPVF